MSIQIHNSLYHEGLDNFELKHQITWYCCGPTVYDESHIGHARTYLSQDIIRRILEDYFNVHVIQCMNITDVDDKIINKARHDLLIKKYSVIHPKVDEIVISDIITSLKLFEESTNELIKIEENQTMIKYYNQQLETINALKKDIEKLKDKPIEEAFLNTFQCEIFAKYLDTKDSKDDEIIITSEEIKKNIKLITEKYEKSFFNDMNMLNIRNPEIIVRVSEQIEIIKSFIQKIIDNGFAYKSNGSVYFDTVRFREKGMKYGKLKPLSENIKNISKDSEKKNIADFVLWKKAKKGEPYWDSQFGPGRPGWHIECSAMSSNVFGKHIDIHSGGQDLCFPHHENELAQSEAYFMLKENWIGTFLHIGHLHINGLKMSKSLKNFITIKEALKQITPNQLRIMFLMQPWDLVINYNQESINDAKNKERIINEFFMTMKSFILTHGITGKEMKDKDKIYLKRYNETVETIDLSLKNNFNTPLSMIAIMKLISYTNEYMNEESNIFLIKSVVNYISKMLKIFGINFDTQFDSQIVDSQFLETWCDFRTNIRKEAIKSKNQNILKMCDEIRDEKMPKFGIKIEDNGKVKFKIGKREEN